MIENPLLRSQPLAAGRSPRSVARFSLAAAALLLLVPAAARPAAGPWRTNPQGSVRLIAAESAVARGGTIHLGVQFRTAPGWHVYWKNPGDAGFPPRVDVLAPPSLRGVALLFPAPRRFELPGGLAAFGYEGEVVYPLTPGTLAEGPDGPVRVEADVDYLTCAADCVPYRYRLALDLRPGGSTMRDPGTAPLVERFAVRVPERDGDLPGVELTAALAPDRAHPTSLHVEARGLAPGSAASLFLEPQDLFETGRPAVRRTADGVAFDVPLARTRTDVPLPGRYELAFTAAGLRENGREVAVEARRAFGSDAIATPIRPAFGFASSLAALLAALAAGLTAASLALWLRTESPPTLGRGLLGFAALGLAVLCLFALAQRVAPVGLALLELCLLGEALALWLRLRPAGPSAGTPRTRLLTVVALVAGLLAAWLALDHALPAAMSNFADSPRITSGDGT